MPDCNFCKRELKPATGTMLVQNTGKIRWFCSSKCEKNLKLKRNPNKFKWSSKEETPAKPETEKVPTAAELAKKQAQKKEKAKAK